MQRVECGRRLTLLVGTLLGTAALVTYVLTLHASLPGGDSGELIAVAYASGTAHPPGYPLYTLLARLFTLVPLGSIAWRVNLLSAVLDAAAAVVLFLAVTRWSRSPWAGLVAGGLFAFAPIVWSYAVVAEVFALNNLFVAILLWLGVRFQERRDVGSAYWAVLTLGLAASNHHTIVLFGIPFGLWLLVTGPAVLRHGAGLARMAGLFVLGLLPYAYLPLAGARLPLMTWGDFSSLGGFLNHFLRRDYGTFQLGAGSARHDQLGTGLVSYFSDLPTELLYIGPVLAAIGLLVMIRREGPTGFAAVTGIAVALYVAIFGSLANLAFDNALMYGVVARFWQQPTVWVAAWTGLGFAVGGSLLRRTSWSRWEGPAAAVTAVTLVGFQIGVHYDDQDQHDNTVVASYGRAILESMPPGALLITLGDLDTNALRYLQLCEQLRPDVRVIDRAMLHYPWTRPVVEAHYPDVALPDGAFTRRDDGDPTTPGLTELIDLNASRSPIFLSRMNDGEDVAWRARYRSWPYGTVEWVVPADAPFDLEQYVTSSNAGRQALQSNAVQDWPATTWEAHVWDRYRDSEFSRGLQLLRHGIELGDDSRPFELARSVFEDLAAAHPNPSPALYKNAGLVYQHLARFDPAYGQRMVQWWTEYLRIAPASDTEVSAIREIVEREVSGN